ncbi:MAG: hypothetical protein WC026_05815 [Hyphomicrobium sp.]|uniref:hypothetical protein n=1 Tax=Hyphomicrobium sp. TaxID=82 RepID=UPI003562D702
MTLPYAYSWSIRTWLMALAIAGIASICLFSQDACASPSNSGPAFLAGERGTLWSPGMMSVGGIPKRSTVCANLSPRGAGLDDTAQIHFAIEKCPEGEIVQLGAGTFLINSGHFLLIHKGITLRGAGPALTTLAKTDGAKPGQEAVGAHPSPLVIVGPSQYSESGNSSGVAASVDLAEDAVKGSYSLTVADAAGLQKDAFVLLDEASGATWQKDPQGRGEIWAAADWRVVWQKHKPAIPYVDDFSADEFPSAPGAAGGWFSRPDRPTAEIKQIASVSGNTITFTTPIHISYRKTHSAQLSRYGMRYVMNAGIEDLKLSGGDAGNLRFHWAAFCWAKNIENTNWHDEGFAIENAFRIELREFYVHDAAWAQPGGGGYAISVSSGASDVLIEDGISVRANKLIVARSAGAGSVVAYNYMDMGYINTLGSWIEVGLNASHMAGSHHVLFEGNYAQNADSDDTHGNSVYHTYFRNYLPGVRASFENQLGGRIDDAAQAENGPKRSAGLMAYSYWMSFAGNVLGVHGKMAGWVYEKTFTQNTPGIWMLGWDSVQPYPTDARVSATTLRHGNFDYVTNTVTWDPNIADRDLPNSLYLTEKPAFFSLGRGYAWPWVDPVAADKIHTLPAKARYDAGTPFEQP